MCVRMLVWVWVYVHVCVHIDIVRHQCTDSADYGGVGVCVCGSGCRCMCEYVYVCTRINTDIVRYEVATISRLLKIVCLFCKRAL